MKIVMVGQGAFGRKHLDGLKNIKDVQEFNADTHALIANAPKEWNVVVIVGQDKSQ